MNRRLEFLYFTKKMLFLFLLGLAIGMTGMTAVISHVQAGQSFTAITLTETEEQGLRDVLENFSGETYESVSLVERPSGQLTADIETIFGLQRFVFEIENDAFTVVDAYRL